MTDNAALKTVKFPKLKRAVNDDDAVIVARNSELEFVNIPKLQSAHPKVEINNNPQLKVLNLGSSIDAGTVIGQNVVVNENPELKWFNMAGMKALENTLEVEENGKLNWISAESLQAVGGAVKIKRNALSGLWLPNLKVVGEDIQVSDDDDIKFISLPKILDIYEGTGGGLTVKDTPKLEVKHNLAWVRPVCRGSSSVDCIRVRLLRRATTISM